MMKRSANWYRPSHSSQSLTKDIWKHLLKFPKGQGNISEVQRLSKRWEKKKKITPVVVASPSVKTCADAYECVDRAPSQIPMSESTTNQDGQKRENLVYVGSLVLQYTLKSFLYGKAVQITEGLHGQNKQHWQTKKKCRLAWRYIMQRKAENVK